MKSKFQILIAVICAAVLVACGGGSKKATAVVVVQPTFKITDTVVGTGTAAAAGDLVVINFVGYLYDSTKVDFKGAKAESSVDTGKPAAPFTVGVGQVVTGWDQSILGMQVGGKRTAILPANLVYGATAHDALPTLGTNVYAAVPANSPMVYDFELVAVTKATTPVTVAPSPLLLSTDVVTGSGTAAAAGSTLTVTYSLYVYDGTRANLRGPLVESNTGFAFKLGAGSVIPGWDQGLVGIMVGGTRTLQIPPSLAYGATTQYDSTGAVKIPANSTLIFDITLTALK